jgi:tetratricopeptide (TPR) repeat protein
VKKNHKKILKIKSPKWLRIISPTIIISFIALVLSSVAILNNASYEKYKRKNERIEIITNSVQKILELQVENYQKGSSIDLDRQEYDDLDQFLFSSITIELDKIAIVYDSIIAKYLNPNILKEYAYALNLTGNFQKSIEVYKSALMIAKSTMDSIRILNDLQRFYLSATNFQDYSLAQYYLQKTIEIAKKARWKDYSNEIIGRNYHGFYVSSRKYFKNNLNSNFLDSALFYYNMLSDEDPDKNKLIDWVEDSKSTFIDNEYFLQPNWEIHYNGHEGIGNIIDIGSGIFIELMVFNCGELIENLTGEGDYIQEKQMRFNILRNKLNTTNKLGKIETTEGTLILDIADSANLNGFYYEIGSKMINIKFK